MGADSINNYIPRTGQKRIVVIGGGFAGINLIQHLDHHNFQIVLIDKHNHHTFQPLLYQVATAGLGPGAIASPLRNVFGKQKNFHFRIAEVSKIDTANHTVITQNDGSIEYDYLVLATGSKANFFGNKEMEAKAFKLKQVTDALAIRERFITNFEEAILNREANLDELMNVVVTGGGPTGVEISGAIAELRNKILPKDYPELDFSKMRIIIVEGQDRLLPTMTPFSSKRAEKYLQDLGVEIRLNVLLEDYTNDTVKLKNGEEIKTKLLIWSAGVQGTAVDGFEENLIHKGTYEVTDYNQIKGYSNVFAIGDTAHLTAENYPKGYPMVAQVAIQQGKQLAKNLIALQDGKEMKPFSYFDKGYMATMGRNKAVVETPIGVKFGGFIGWVAWLFVHLISIIGVQNKLVTLGYWAYNYLTFNKGNRLLIQSSTPKPVVDETPTKRETELQPSH